MSIAGENVSSSSVADVASEYGNNSAMDAIHDLSKAGGVEEPIHADIMSCIKDCLVNDINLDTHRLWTAIFRVPIDACMINNGKFSFDH